jgi:hypothetical protein
MIMSLRRVLLQPVSVRCCAKDAQARSLNEGLGSFHIAIGELSLRLAPGDRQPTFSDGRFSPQTRHFGSFFLWLSCHATVRRRPSMKFTLM